MQISNSITDETKEYIRTENNEIKEKKLWGENIQCHYIPYKPAKKPLAKLIKKPATVSAFVTDFSMKYNNNSASKDINVASAPKPVSKVPIVISTSYLFISIFNLFLMQIFLVL